MCHNKIYEPCLSIFLCNHHTSAQGEYKKIAIIYEAHFLLSKPWQYFSQMRYARVVMVSPIDFSTIVATFGLKMSSTQLLPYRLLLWWVSFWLLFIWRYVTYNFNHGPGQYRKSYSNLAEVGACPAVLYIIKLGKFGRCIYRLYIPILAQFRNNNIWYTAYRYRYDER